MENRLLWLFWSTPSKAIQEAKKYTAYFLLLLNSKAHQGNMLYNVSSLGMGDTRIFAIFDPFLQSIDMIRYNTIRYNMALNLLELKFLVQKVL